MWIFADIITMLFRLSAPINVTVAYTEGSGQSVVICVCYMIIHTSQILDNFYGNLLSWLFDISSRNGFNSCRWSTVVVYGSWILRRYDTATTVSVVVGTPYELPFVFVVLRVVRLEYSSKLAFNLLLIAFLTWK